MPEDILQNFSTNYKQVLIKSINLAWQLNTEIIKPEYILYALISQKGSIGSEILLKANLKETEIKKFLINNNKLAKKKFLPFFTEETIKLIEKSAALAFANNHPYIATEHLLLAIIENKTGSLQKIFNQQKVNQDFIKNQIQIIFNSTSKFQDFTSAFDNLPEKNQTELHEPYPVISKTSLLKSFTTDLTDRKIQKNIDPLIGREDEITRLIEILMRRTKNNPMILGDPGVGKTALVEGLAKKIIKGQVPEILSNKKILALDIAAIVAGTMFRGEFENRMKNILAEIKKDPNIIIFIDEIHNIIGAGSTQGAMDVANIIKPALARGEIRCIGATTYEEYKKHLENDAALERRFQLVKIKEPSINETIKIIQGIKDNYENYHDVKITDQAINIAVQLSEKYITDRYFPDKAIDLIDESASKMKIKQKTDKHLCQLKEAEKKLAKIKKDKESAIIKENFKQAILLKIQEKEQQEQIQKIKTIIKTKNKKQQIVTKKEICQIVSKITSIPTNELLFQEKKKFLNLEKTLAKHIIGQDKALTILAQSIRRNKAGITEQNKPLGSFILIGPSGTGKTYTAKILNKILFDNKKSLIKIDMSEFSEKFNISKLIGAPAGYVGYKESGKLTDAVKRNPYSIILFDEIEKAHPDVFNLLLQIFDDGYLTDAVGKKINFKNTLIILTSNLGTARLDKIIGFDKENKPQNELVLEKEIKNFFPPEFVNRLDKIIIFNQLDKKALTKIIKIELKKLQNQLNKQNIKLEFDNKIIKFLLTNNFRQEQNARFVKQNIEELIANPLSEKIFSQEKNNPYKITVKDNNLQILNA